MKEPQFDPQDKYNYPWEYTQQHGKQHLSNANKLLIL